jgi:hypothetical protein
MDFLHRKKILLTFKFHGGCDRKSSVSAVITMQDDLGSFTFITNVLGSQIQISIINQVNKAIIPSEYYSMLKNYYQGMIDKQNEKNYFNPI